MPKILFIAYKYDYGKPELGFSPEYYIFYDTFKKMNNKENEVIYFAIDEITARTTGVGEFEILWGVPRDLAPGTYLIKASDPFDEAETTFVL